MNIARYHVRLLTKDRELVFEDEAPESIFRLLQGGTIIKWGLRTFQPDGYRLKENQIILDFTEVNVLTLS